MSVILKVISAFDDSGISKAQRSLAKFGAASKFAGGSSAANLIQAGTAVQAFGKKVSNVGDSMSTKFTLPVAVAFGVATKMAIDEQKEMALLSQAMKKNAGATDVLVASTEKWVTATQNATGIADGELRPSLAALVRSTKDVGKAQDLLGIAMDISTAKGKPLQTVAEAIAKAYAGNTAALGRLGISMKDAKGETVSFEEVMARAQRTFGGATAKAADTASGRLEILKNRLADTGESVGTSLIPAVEQGAEVVGNIADRFNEMSPATQGAIVKTLLFGAAIGPVLSIGGRLIGVGGGIAKVLGNVGLAFGTNARYAPGYARAIANITKKLLGLKAAAAGVDGLPLGGGKAPSGGGLPGAGAGAAAGGTALASYAGAVAAALAPIVVATVLTKTQQYIEGKTGAAATSAQNKSAGGAFYGSSKGYGAGGGKYKGEQLAAAQAAGENLNKPLVQRLTIQAQNKTGPAFAQVMQDYQTIKTLTDAGIELKIDKEKPLSSLQSIQARLMSTGQTAGEAIKTMERLFGKDVVKPLRDSIARTEKTMESTKQKVTAKHAQMAAALMKKIPMPAPDAGGMLSVLNSIIARMQQLGYSAAQAADAVARAVSAQGHLKSGVGAGGHVVDEARGGVYTLSRPMHFRAGEAGREIAAFFPLSDPARSAALFAELEERLTGRLRGEGPTRPAIARTASQPSMAGGGDTYVFEGCLFAQDFDRVIADANRRGTVRIGRQRNRTLGVH